MRKLRKGVKCEYEDCTRDATEIVYSRNLKRVILCCDAHSYVIIKEGGPEYLDYCQNCGCRQGVN